MKTKTLLYALAFLVVVLAGMGSFAADKNKYGFIEPSPYEENIGTWVNTEYSGGSYMPQKFVDYYWGGYDIYMLATNKTPDYRGCGIIVDKWKDAAGNTWYKKYNLEDWTTNAIWAIVKVSKDGKVKEFVWQYFDFPSENDMNSKNTAMHYHIYYKQ